MERAASADTGGSFIYFSVGSDGWPPDLPYPRDAPAFVPVVPAGLEWPSSERASGALGDAARVAIHLRVSDQWLEDIVRVVQATRDLQRFRPSIRLIVDFGRSGASDDAGRSLLALHNLLPWVERIVILGDHSSLHGVRSTLAAERGGGVDRGTHAVARLFKEVPSAYTSTFSVSGSDYGDSPTQVTEALRVVSSMLSERNGHAVSHP